MLGQLSATNTVVRSVVTGKNNAKGPYCRASCNSTVLAHTIAHTIPIAQALQLLGKLGGRNRRFLKDPLELEYKDNPEHGLRLILTFQPATSFLVPLDRTITLVRGALLPDGSAARLQPFARSEALRFLQVCWLFLHIPLVEALQRSTRAACGITFVAETALAYIAARALFITCGSSHGPRRGKLTPSWQLHACDVVECICSMLRVGARGST